MRYGQGAVASEAAEVLARYTCGAEERKEPESMPESGFDPAISKCIGSYDVFVPPARGGYFGGNTLCLAAR